MRAPDDSIDYSQVFSKHYDPALAEERIKAATSLLSSSKRLTAEERSERGWDEAYDLRPWREFPDTERANVTSVVLQNLTRGLLGVGGGPIADTILTGDRIRDLIVSGAPISTS